MIHIQLPEAEKRREVVREENVESGGFRLPSIVL